MTANTARIPLIRRLGGEDRIRQLVETFYDIIETEPEGAPLMILHLRGHGIAHSRIEQFNFLCGFFGGTNLYLMKHGRSNLREMHAHVPIRPSDAEAWLRCMDMAFARVGIAGELKEEAMSYFTRGAQTLVNKPHADGRPDAAC